MAKIEVVRARASHLRRIAAVMRQADQDEVTAMTGRAVLPALVASYRRSSVCMVALVDGLPEVIFGAGDLSILTGEAAPWLLGSDAVVTHRREFLRRSVWWRDQLLKRYSVLRNVVDCRNTAAVRWLRWLGFELSEPFLHRGFEFRLFEMRG